MAESVSPFLQDIPVNIVLEESPFDGAHNQTVKMVGFVMVDDIDLKLSELRLKIMDQFDDAQVQLIGLNFKFLKKTYPVSSKQETLLSTLRICVHVSPPHQPLQGTTKSTTAAFPLQSTPKPSSSTAASSQNVTVLVDNDVEMHTSTNPTPPDPERITESNCNSNHIETNNKNNDEDIEDQEFQLDQLQPFDALPHHYQYASINNSLLLASPLNPPINLFPRNKPIGNTLFPPLSKQKHSAFPTVKLSQCPQVIKNKSEKSTDDEPQEYTVIIRACHSILRRSASDQQLLPHHSTETDNILHHQQQAPLDRFSKLSASMSVFAGFDGHPHKSTASDYQQKKSVSPIAHHTHILPLV
eukprot:CAMPEP_0197033014 /NCGR_PEP_ID=MMETSP1384-20130603/11535_1 /TAXON_ID=29189 /ORGANISM="Ammonia sp." /LENGTH=355 /DNA_ID=CAMNT_0042462755 /DNA_START=37 /DNA_END=1100 /DNA_ORIENTATION=+